VLAAMRAPRPRRQISALAPHKTATNRMNTLIVLTAQIERQHHLVNPRYLAPTFDLVGAFCC
jgi:hypothetical protein